MDKTNYQDQLHKALQLYKNRQFDKAEALYHEILAVRPDDPNALQFLGLIEYARGKLELARPLLETASELLPDFVPVHHNLASLYRALGELQLAQITFRRTIALEPGHGEAWQGLAEIVKFQPDDDFIRDLRVQLAVPGQSDQNRSYLYFAAGKYLDDTGCYNEAFKQYVRANHYANRSFNIEPTRMLFKELLFIYSKNFLASLPQGHDSEQPVFVVGLPRSGSSLIEQILASHHQVYGAGELPDLAVTIKQSMNFDPVGRAWPLNVAGLGGQAYRKLAAYYLDLVSARIPGNFDRIVDKQPLNFRFIGLIFSMFPKARVIHAVRHPLDTCLSCFFQNFSSGQDFTFDLKNLAAYYQSYQRLMEHWHSLFTDRILAVHYEALVENQEAETRRMLDFCGLDFDPACLDFHQTRRLVRTASFQQVKTPLYRSSLQRWRNYQKHIGELADDLGLAMEQEAGGAYNTALKQD